MVVKEADCDLQTLETNSHKEASIVTLIMLVLIGGTIGTYNITFLYNFIVEEEHSYMLTFNMKDIDIGKKFLFIQFFCLIVGTLFVYCWYGEQIATLSKSIAYSSYDTHWYNRTKEFKSLILQMVTRSQKPVYLTACGFVNATLESYSAVLQASLSYFTLLRTVGNTDEVEA
ncbi:odorant receptor 4-like [Chrysoperla carnea]|uniref:odorant receptor 4-like n=1 Tax=Chrysoperla carnea TaxID=189513 RepID=UPI001D079F99|nr:odorant receptor 4-like [Chrysoperla carnea]